MKCPNCDKEPFKVFNIKPSGLGIWKSINGQIKCVHCDTILKRKYGKPFWISLITTILVYAAIYILLKFQPIDMSIFPPWLFIFLVVVMIILLGATAFAAVLFLSFEEVSENITIAKHKET